MVIGKKRNRKINRQRESDGRKKYRASQHIHYFLGDRLHLLGPDRGAGWRLHAKRHYYRDRLGDPVPVLLAQRRIHA